MSENKIPFDANYRFQIMNSNGTVDTSTLGYQYTIQTTTQIRAEVIAQKFYEVPIADFVPVVVGTGAWMESIKTNLTYDSAGDFESGIQDNATGPSQIAQVDVATAPKSAKLIKWYKGYQYTVPEIQSALASNNWDVVASKMKALKKNWDLGLQKVAFLGLKSDIANVPGLLSSAEVVANTAIITGKISTLSADNFQTLVAALLGAYFSNSNSTVLPDTFIMPMSDYLGMAAAASSAYPLISKLEYLKKAFAEITGNPNFVIKGLAYADQANNAGYWAVAGTNRYVLYRKDSETVKMDVPVDFNLYPVGTANNFQFQGVGAGQFSGAIVYRVPEVLYFDWHV